MSYSRPDVAQRRVAEVTTIVTLFVRVMGRGELLRSRHHRGYLGNVLAELLPHSIVAPDDDDSVCSIVFFFLSFVYAQKIVIIHPL